ncbi:MAG TPA: hypothetical protein VJB05_03305 [archaeon]|nr:hypothetical protein [archaeon]
MVWYLPTTWSEDLNGAERLTPYWFKTEKTDFSLHHNHLFSVKCLVRNRDGTRSWESDSCYNPADHVYDPNRTQYMDLINSLRDTIRHKQTVK